MNMKCVDILYLLTVHLMKKNNKLDYYRGKDCLKKFCQDLRKQAKSIIDFEKKEMIELAPEEVYKHYIEKYCFICKNHFLRIIITNIRKKIMIK